MSFFNFGNGNFSIKYVGSFNLRGISGDFVNTASEAIENYITGIEDVLKKIKSTTESDIDTALKGSVQQGTVNGYMDNVVLQIKSVADLMRDFKTAITTVYEKYGDQDSSITNIGDVEDAKSATGYDSSEGITGVSPFGE